MLYTFREMQRQVADKIQNQSTSSTNDNDILPKIKDWLNNRYYRLYRSSLWRELLNDSSLTLTASTGEYAFDRSIGKILKVFDTTNGKTIKEDTIENHITNIAGVREKVGNTQTDNPTTYRLTGQFQVKNETSQAETIDIVSSSALDVSPNIVRVEGLVSGVEIGEDIVLTGTSSATSANTYDSGQKLKISVGTSTGVRKTIVGVITVSGTTSSTEYTKIAPSEFAHQYQWFKVSPVPKATGTQPTWEIWAIKDFRRLDNDNDIPMFDCCTEVIQGAYADALREDGLEQEANIAEQAWVGLVAELKAARKSFNESGQFKPVNRENFQWETSPYGWV